MLIITLQLTTLWHQMTCQSRQKKSQNQRRRAAILYNIYYIIHYDYYITVDDFVAPDDMSEPSEEESEPEDKDSDFIFEEDADSGSDWEMAQRSSSKVRGCLQSAYRNIIKYCKLLYFRQYQFLVKLRKKTISSVRKFVISGLPEHSLSQGDLS